MSRETPSKSFDRLHPEVQRWIWRQNWSELRDAQEQAVEPILRGDTDVVIASATASGKTEAAFLPIASVLAAEPERQGLAIYISPLKALINDQYDRLGPFFEQLEIPVWPWHGDIAASVKSRFRSRRCGVLLITPESLEALFVIHGHQIHHILRNTRYAVIDELHSFIGTERGMQVQSLLNRLEQAIGRQVPRIGLSATLGNLSLAAEYLRTGGAQAVFVIESVASGQELKILIRGYEETFAGPAGAPTDAKAGEEHENEAGMAQQRIADDMFRVLRGTNNLVFANSRSYVESYADLLATRCERAKLPAEFWPHHGSLSKELRESVEQLLKDKVRPTTAVCTSTLELGIDIGTVKSVAQIGSPFSVASLRQRLGRSGRRNEPAILRMYVEEDRIQERTGPVDRIRAELVQSIASIRLLLGKWCEPPEAASLHLSTLVHQLLALIAEKGGIQPKEAWRILCDSGPFRQTGTQQFAEVLRAIAEAGLLMQSDDGTLLHAPAGERIVNHYSFYAVFQTGEEFRLVTESGRTLGTLPVDYPLQENMLIIFAGRRWRILNVDEERQVILVTGATGGKVPRFAGSGGRIHDHVREEMKSVYMETGFHPAYLDATATELLAEGRRQFFELGLHKRSVVMTDDGGFLFLWKGNRVANTVTAQLQSTGLMVHNNGLTVQVYSVSQAELKARLKQLVEVGPADAIMLARTVQNKQFEKYHPYLSEELLCQDYAISMLDTAGAWAALRAVSSEES